MAEPFSLSTDRLTFRPFVEDDFEDLRRFHTDPAVQTGYDPTGRAWSDEAIAQRLKSYIAEHERQGFSRWKLSLRSGQFVGRAGLGWHVEGESVELGYGLLPQFWGFGYAREAASALVGWGFGNLPVSKIVAFTYRHNPRSRRALVALGFKHVDDRLRSANDGVCAYYEIEREEAGALQDGSG
jgi:ribosomal-protein-alanine N-acetyltransferase